MSEPSDRDLLAAECVLGTLEGEEALEAARLLRDDPTFAAAVRAWEARLAPLANTVPPVTPPPELWERIAAATGVVGAAPGAVGAATAAAAGTVRTSAETTGVASDRPAAIGANNVVPLSMGRRLRVWQASTSIALAVAASLAAFIVLRPVPALRVAILTPLAGGVPVLVATAQPNGTLDVHPKGTIAVPDGSDLELWALAAGETRPHSLGVLPAGGRHVVATLPPGTQLLVSLEPRGGSPTGQPTGPVLYGGRLSAMD
jgi:anti-sigma-K factor RskA